MLTMLSCSGLQPVIESVVDQGSLSGAEIVDLLGLTPDGLVMTSTRELEAARSEHQKLELHQATHVGVQGSLESKFQMHGKVTIADIFGAH